MKDLKLKVIRIGKRIAWFELGDSFFSMNVDRAGKNRKHEEVVKEVVRRLRG